MVISKEVRSKLNGLDRNTFLWHKEIPLTSSKKQRLQSNRKHYMGFQLNSLTVLVGDCVHINIGICLQYDASEKVAIARILECYDDGSKNVKGFVKVQWYSQITALRKIHLNKIPEGIPPLDDHMDIVKDMWAYETNVDLETIIGHCHIAEVNSSVSPDSVQKPPLIKGPLYICRFMYVKNSPWLIPLKNLEGGNKIDLSPLRRVSKSPKNCFVPLVDINKSPKVDISPKDASYSQMINSGFEMPDKDKYDSTPKRRGAKRKLLDADEDQENCFKKSKRPTSLPVIEKKDKPLLSSLSPIKVGILEELKISSPKVSVNQKLKSDVKPPANCRGLQTKDIVNLLSNEQDCGKIGSDKLHLKNSEEKLSGEVSACCSRVVTDITGVEKRLTANQESPNSKDEKGYHRTPRRVSILTEKMKDYTFEKSRRSPGFFKSRSESVEDSDSEECTPTQTSHRLRQKRKTIDGTFSRSREAKKYQIDKPDSIRCQVQKKKLEDSEDEDFTVRKKKDSNKRQGATPLKSGNTSLKNCDTSKVTPSKAMTVKPTPVKRGCTPNLTPQKNKTAKQTPLKGDTTKLTALKGKAAKSTPLKKLDPSVKLPQRVTPLAKRITEFEQARAQLHVSAIPPFLPCREEEFQHIYSFVEGKLLDSTGGCMYVSGVPGTGKTATIREVVRLLQECEQDGTVPSFHFLEVNAMKLTMPHQLWVQIWEGLSGLRVTADHAYSLFQKSLSIPSGPQKKSIFLLLDELDLLWTRKQDVMYNLFDLSSRVDSRLIVVTIANTMDLPERMMISRVSSRLGLTRMTFHPYNFRQLEEIITTRLKGIKAFDPDAIQLVSRKVAAVSGDARRALDVCRRATELAEQTKIELLSSPQKSLQKVNVLVGMTHVSAAIEEMFSSPKIKAIRCSSQMEKYILEAIFMEFNRTGLEEAVSSRVFEHLDGICRFEGFCPPSSSETFKLINNLSSQKILLTEHSRLDLLLRIRFNVSCDDVSYALKA